MTRIWQQLMGKANGSRPSGPQAAPRAELYAPGMQAEHYVTRPARPMTQLAARVGLWSAVGLGCLGGLLGLMQPADGDPAPVVAEEDHDEVLVPAPVAGLAELVVREWLPATDDDEERLGQLFAEPPSLSEIDTENLAIWGTTTIAGRRLEEMYWTVTVAAVVVETVNGEEQPAVTWYVEVPIVGDVSGGLVALKTPAVLPGPPEAADGWAVAGPSPVAPDDDDDAIVTMVEGFLNALLAGDGDPSRYVTPQLTVRAADPAPFAEIDVQGIAVEEREDGTIRVRASVRATTEGGSRQTLDFEMVASQRVDRWEVVEFPAIPIVELPQAPEGSSGEPDEPSDASGESPDDPESSDTPDDGDGHAHDHSGSQSDVPSERGSSEAIESSTTTAVTSAEPGA